VLDEQRTTTTPTLKSGQPGKTKVGSEPEDALKVAVEVRPMPSRGLCPSSRDLHAQPRLEAVAGSA
jgi:hypothetical protein